MTRSLYFLALLALVFVPTSHAATDTFMSTADNTLYESSTGATSNGAGIYFFTGMTNAGEVRRGLIKFDVSSIPAGARITDVTLTLELSRKPPGAPAVDTTVHLLTADWGEGASDAGDPGGNGAMAAVGDATWIHTFSPGSLWTNEGGDFVAAASATLNVDAPGSYDWISTLGGVDQGLVDDVQGWVDTPADNFGWLILGDESASPTGRRFDTRENLASNPPTLTITFLELVFVDSFESGDFTAWSSVVP